MVNIRHGLALTIVVVFVYLRIEQMTFAYLPDYVGDMPKVIECSNYRYLEAPRITPPCS